MPVYLRSSAGELVRMREEPYVSEEALQALVAQHPELLAGDRDSAGRWLLVNREMPTPGDDSHSGRWSLDHLFVDAEGIPTLVEVKRASDTRIRREVVGQLLDYAANGVLYWPQGELAERFTQTCRDELGREPDEVLDEFLDAGQESGEFWARVETNLRSGRLRLVFLADAIPSELQRVVEFLNEQMHLTEVLAIEVRRYQSDDGHETLVPRTLGQTAAATAAKRGRATRQWTEETFLQALEENAGAGYRQTAEAYLAWGRTNGGVVELGSGTTRGSLQLRWTVDGQSVKPLGLLTTGSVYIGFAQLAKAAPFAEREQRQAYADQLNAIDGLTVPDDGIDRYPEIPVGTLGDEPARSQLLDALDWFIEQIGRTPQPRQGPP